MLIFLSIVVVVLFLYATLMTVLFLTVEKQYAKHFKAYDEELKEREKADLETVEGLRGLLQILKEFKINAYKITKKYDLINHPDFVEFQSHLVSLNDIIEVILRNEGGERDGAESNVKEEGR